MPIARMEHVRAAGLCAPGARVWARWAVLHGIDWKRFVREGLPVDQLEATGDHFAIAVATIARREVAHG
jgi:hypothetical protein